MVMGSTLELSSDLCFQIADSSRSVLGLGRPDPSLVHRSQMAMAAIDADLSLHLSFLPSLIDPIPDHDHRDADVDTDTDADVDTDTDVDGDDGDDGDACSRRQERHLRLRESAMRHEAELVKQPHKAIIALSDLHRMYDDLIDQSNTRRKIQKKINQKKNSQYSYGELYNGFQGVAEFIVRQASMEEKSKLDLSFRLLGHIPPSLELLDFSSLIFLDLSKNQLKELPDVCIEKLRSLETLDLHSNQLTALPPAIGLLSKLKKLDLSGNMLADLHENLGGCRSLREFIAAFNQLESLPWGIGNGLTSLTILTLHSNRLLSLPPSICELIQLKVLDLHFNRLTSLPARIGCLRSLEKLDLSSNFSDFGPGGLPRSIGDLSRLGSLDLSYNQLKELPDSVGSLYQLQVLKLHNNPLIVPPKKVVEHSTDAVLEYMRERWKSAASRSHSGQNSGSPPIIYSSYNWLSSFASHGSCKSTAICASLQPVSSLSIVPVNRRPRGSMRLTRLSP